MKRLLTLFACLACLALLAAPAAMAAEAPAGPITLQMPPGAKAHMPTVTFQHDWHKALECTACHHKWDGNGQPQKCKSSGCHDDVSVKNGVRAYYLAYHKLGKQSCLGCHKEMKKAKAPKYGPTKCNGCHKKK